MNSLLIVGSFMLGAGSGGFCVFLQQRGFEIDFVKKLHTNWTKHCLVRYADGGND